MLKIISAAALGAAAFISSPAGAQPWGAYVGGGGGYYHPRSYWMDNLVQSVCSGQRAHTLESRLRHEESEGEIDPYSAARLHQSIDRLENQQRHECAEGDWRSIARIGSGYDRIGQRIEAEAHGYRRWD